MTDLYGIDARTGDRIEPPVRENTPEEVAAACAAAERAAPDLAALPLTARAGLLRAMADGLDATGDELVTLADRETALGTNTLRAELARMTGQLRLKADEVLRADFLAPRSEDGPDGTPHFRRVLVPIGPVAVYAASNFPFALAVAGSDTAAALAAGCPVVVKAHPGHPTTSRRIAEIVAEALRASDAPDGSFAVVHGMAAGRELIHDPRIKAGSFTGSQAGGRALFDAAAARPEPIPFYGELGSVNPVFITRAAVKARPADLVSGFVTAAGRYVGQLCTNPGLLFLPEGHGLYDDLVVELSRVPAAPLLNLRILDGFREGTARLAAHAEQVLGTPDGPHLFRTTVEEFAARPALSEECFGPASLVVEYADEAQLPALAARLPGSLTATVHAEDGDEALVRDLLPVLTRKAGRVVWNGWPTGVAVNRVMHHGGPWPATTGAAHTSVGTESIRRFQVPVVFQDVPQGLLPAPLRG
ncbi:aldehyde dehydrogenase (NADP(+)) [Streptomyces cavernicola]|uniref:Aldehyde dehydrogenase (NADP(+)) n=1 Tax=Streptomyces cavernicola TaxID=3043613 RepID=A0ABT6SFG6_9ACTN|nr:aldehyde dehydrogenase (NADP(+)) [Streptomyces sp. B-S-A6]MDI3406417.1 aldehyde dehydrogenase (NADP(+)) [Streptomyces sp. B-S-A6]